jgi:Fe-S cluster assembly protein SufD
MPSRRDEGWRWSDVQRVLRELPPQSPPAAVAAGAGPFHGLAAQEFAFFNGRGSQEPVRAEREVIVRFISDAVGTGHQARLRLVVPPGASATLFESYEGFGSSYFANTLIEIEVGAGAQLERIVRLDEPAKPLRYRPPGSTAHGSNSPTTVSHPRPLQRLEDARAHPGRRASARLDGVYVLDGPGHADFTTR